MDYLLLAAAVALVVSWVCRRRRVFISTWMLAPVFASVVVTAFSAVIAGDSSSPATDLVRVMMSTTVVAVLLTSVADTSGRPALRQVLGWWAAGVAVSSLASGGVSLGVLNFSGLLVQPTGLRLSGLSSHPNSIAFSVTMALPVVLYLASSAKSRLLALCWVAAFGVSIWGLVLADSRSGLLVAIPSVAVALVLSLVQSRLRLLAAPILVVAGVLAAAVVPDAVSETRLIQGSAQSDAGRVVYNDDALRTFAESPIFGGGFAAQSGVAVPLMVLSAGGFVLAIGYYLFVMYPLPAMWRSRRDRMAQTGILSVMVFLAFGLLNPVFAERATFWPALVAFTWVTFATAPRRVEPFSERALLTGGNTLARTQRASPARTSRSVTL